MRFFSGGQPTKLITAGMLILFFGVAMYLRAYLPYEQILGGDWIKFASIDAYYQMYLVYGKCSKVIIQMIL